MKLFSLLTITLFVFGLTACILAQDGLGERIREMQKRRHQNPQNYISNVPNTVQKSFEFERVKRTFLVHTPKNYDGKKDLPLVLNFHGGVGTGKQQERKTGFSHLADRENFIVVYPDGVNNQWNDGRGAAFSGAPTANDVGFVNALIDFMRKNYRVDQKRIYATGGSNGGIFTNRLGIELSDKLAAIAPVVGNLPIDKQTDKTFMPQLGATKPLPVLLINGTEDQFVKWDGGRVRGGGKVTSVAETVRAWVKSNGCQATPKIENLPDKFADDETTVRRETYANCRDKTEVVLYAVVGGGHGWYGMSDDLQTNAVRNVTGNLSREVNSTEVIWEFFKKHSRR